VAPGNGQPFDSLHFFGLQPEIKNFQIGPHVGSLGCPGQRHYANFEGEPENNLARGPTVALGDPG